MSSAIFVFTGTGNSLQIAKAVAERTGADILMLPGSGETDISGYGSVGFVFPVHYYKPPLPVEEALMSLRFSEDQDIWAVMDYGTTPGDAMMRMHRMMEATGANVLFSVGYRMPENYIMMFDPPSEEECASMCSAVPGYADEVCSMLESGGRAEPVSKLSGRMISFVGSRFYDRWRTTAKFTVSEACTSCGLCRDICPSQAIRMCEDRPVWVKDRCLHCAGCINRCPAEAIGYGGKSSKRRRYVNPVLKS